MSGLKNSPIEPEKFRLHFKKPNLKCNKRRLEGDGPNHKMTQRNKSV